MKIKHLFFAMFVFIACSKTNDESSSPAPVNITNLSSVLSIQEAAHITGENYTQTDTSSLSNGTIVCTYSYTTVVSYYPMQTATGKLSVSIYQTSDIKGSSQKSVKAYYDDLKKSNTYEAFSGIGNDAFISKIDGILHVLYTDNYYIEISITLAVPTSNDQETMKVKAAQKVVENLKLQNSRSSSSSKIISPTKL